MLDCPVHLNPFRCTSLSPHFAVLYPASSHINSISPCLALPRPTQRTAALGKSVLFPNLSLSIKISYTCSCAQRIRVLPGTVKPFFPLTFSVWQGQNSYCVPLYIYIFFYHANKIKKIEKNCKVYHYNFFRSYQVLLSLKLSYFVNFPIILPYFG